MIGVGFCQNNTMNPIRYMQFDSRVLALNDTAFPMDDRDNINIVAENSCEYI